MAGTSNNYLEKFGSGGTVTDGGDDAISQDTGTIEIPVINDGSLYSAKYRTTGGDRWDTIAQKSYGDPMLAKVIIAANPTVPIIPVLPGGVELFIPVLPGATLSRENLPPWKR